MPKTPGLGSGIGSGAQHQLRSGLVPKTPGLGLDLVPKTPGLGPDLAHLLPSMLSHGTHFLQLHQSYQQHTDDRQTERRVYNHPTIESSKSFGMIKNAQISKYTGNVSHSGKK